MVTTISNGIPIPASFPDLLDFTQALPHPIYYEAVKNAKVVEGPYIWPVKECTRYYYEQVDLPPGVLITGDAIINQPPSSIQGITVCFLQAKELEKLLAKDIHPYQITSDFFQQITPLLNGVWINSINGDRQFTEGKCDSFKSYLTRKYFALLMKLGNNERFIQKATLDAMQLIGPKAVIFEWRFLIYAFLYLIGLKPNPKTQRPFPRGDPKDFV